MIYAIPTTSLEPDFEQTQTLDGTQYQIEFLWNARASRWFMTLLDTEGTPLATGRKMVTGPWASRETIDDRLPGQLWVHPTEATDADPGLRDLGNRVYLMYVDEDSNT